MTKEELFYNDLLLDCGIVIEIILAAVILVGYQKRRYFNVALRFMFYYLVVGFIILILLSCFSWVTKANPVFWQPILDYLKIQDTTFFALFAYINSFILLGLYYTQAVPMVTFRAYIKPLSWLLLAITSIDYFFVTGYNNYSSFSQTVLAFYILLLPMAHLWYLYRAGNKVPLNRNPYFWIAMGLVLPSILTIWLELYGAKLLAVNFILFCQVSIGNVLFYCIGQLLIAVGFYYARYVQYLPNN
jgi:hypothetical protein